MRTTNSSSSICIAIVCGVLAAIAPKDSAAQPVLYFSDITSGPRAGNSDNSLGQTPGENGAIVTIWGRNLSAAHGSVEVFCNGAEAGRVYLATSARVPSNLSAFHGMEMISFQVSSRARDGAGEIYATVDGLRSNALPFTVRPGRIFYARRDGSDSAGDGSWALPFRTIVRAKDALLPGDIAYICDGVEQTEETEFGGCVNLGRDGTAAAPIALVVYPGARSTVGNTATERAFHVFDGENSRYSTNWVIAKFDIVTGSIGVMAQSGYRVIGNHVTAPNGNGPEGAIEGEGSSVFILGNELDRVGGPASMKQYHGIYIKGTRLDLPPRAPTESGREVAWNYIHDCLANRGINVYSEQEYAAFIEGHRIHDNVIVNQHGDGILLGYYVTGENWIYNNLLIAAGGGPEWPEDISSHAGIHIDNGHDSAPRAIVHCYGNTLYGCGWAGSEFPEESGSLLVSRYALDMSTLDFANNIVVSTGAPYLATGSAEPPPGDYANCWYGAGDPPAWDRRAVGADPAFVDPASNDFRLRPGSRAIDAGRDLSSLVPMDLLGARRPQGAGVDLGAFESAAAAGVDDTDASRPEGPLALLSNSPNPFHASTAIRYNVPRAGRVVLTVHSLLGETVALLVDRDQAPGEHVVEWRPAGLPKGIYACRLTIGDGAVGSCLTIVE